MTGGENLVAPSQKTTKIAKSENDDLGLFSDDTFLSTETGGSS
jgi:hypothetical protein